MHTSYQKAVLMMVSTLSLILTPVVLSATLSLKVGTVESSDQSIEVPMSATQCDGLGALQFSLTYDAEVIEPTSVDAGGNLTSGLVEFDIKSPGTVRVGMISSNPVKGAGELLKVTFKRLTSEDGKSDLSLNEVIAWDHKNNTEMLVTHEAGSVVLKNNLGLLPENLIPDYLKMPIIIGGVVLILFVILVTILKRSKKKTTSPDSAFCSKCGSPHSIDAKFCPKCGQAI